MLRPNELFDGTYKVIDQIGRGGTSAVWLAYHVRLQKHVVLKRISTRVADPDLLRLETDILKNLHHPCLPQVYDFICRDGEVYTVMDYVEGRSLQEVAKQGAVRDEHQLLRWFRQLAEVLDYLHSRRPAILHSDIKPENILLTPGGQVCLIDFNISLDSTRPHKVVGYSPYFASPEQAAMAAAIRQKQPCPYTLDARSDIYSLAATFYYLMTGLHPHATHVCTPLCAMQGLPYSPGFMAVIDKAMAWDREKRYPNAKKLLAALDQLKKQDHRYKQYMALRAGSWLAGALMLALGSFCLVRGVQQTRLDAYRSDYDSFIASVEGQAYEQALQQGLELLNDARYQRILADRPQDSAAILHALGDSSYESGDTESAQAYYGDALAAMPAASAQRDRYYLDYAVALAEDGRTVQARQVLEKAEAGGAGATACAMIRAGLASGEGDPAACEAEVETVLAAAGGDPALCARACLLAARSWQADTAHALPWLQRARQYNETPRILRQLGAACAVLAKGQPNVTAQREMAQQALDCYTLLCARADPQLEDRINCAVLYYMLDRQSDCLQLLLPCEQERPQDYRVQAYLAFSYYAAGDQANAAVHCSNALRCLAQLPEDQQEAVDETAVQELKRMQKLLGI